jgi:hypothetical protein
MVPKLYTVKINILSYIYLVKAKQIFIFSISKNDSVTPRQIFSQRLVGYYNKESTCNATVT